MISIIIPTLNEEENLPNLFYYIKNSIGCDIPYEVIICDGGSQDRSVLIAKKNKAKVIHSNKKNRAFQMNLGAQNSSGELLYFLHADTLPPKSFGQTIQFYFQNNLTSGCFRLSFDNSHWLLSLSSWATRFNLKYFQFGDQSLFISKTLFEQIGGYNIDLQIMEDVDIINRIRKKSKFIIAPDKVISSARRYLYYGVIKTELTHLLILLMYMVGCNQQLLLSTYSKLIPSKKSF